MFMGHNTAGKVAAQASDREAGIISVLQVGKLRPPKMKTLFLSP